MDSSTLNINKRTGCGGYDEGYAACSHFWGNEPGSLLLKAFGDVDVSGLRVLDAGCGDGKNALWLAERGADVLAFDISALALRRAMEHDVRGRVSWMRASVTALPMIRPIFDLVVVYGLLHCLESRSQVEHAISALAGVTRLGGLQLVATFNDRDQDLELAHPGFAPHLAAHEFFLQSYAAWNVEFASDTTLHEAHPHNGVTHHHSMTRLIARKRLS